jgi:hypothetical protein
MDFGYRSLVVARAWVQGKSTSNPKVNLDISGDFGFRIFGNPQAQKEHWPTLAVTRTYSAIS